ncbi:MAG: hypothetical protein AB1640_01100 [bacterium]
MIGRRICLVAVFLSTPFLAAMGIMGEPSPLKRVPETPKAVSAVLVDADGITTKVDSFSYDGELYLPAYRGRGLVVLPFDEIAAVHFGEIHQGRREATVRFRNQEEESFLVEDKLLFVGKVSYGTFQIQVKDLRSIRLVDGPSE